MLISRVRGLGLTLLALASAPIRAGFAQADSSRGHLTVPLSQVTWKGGPGIWSAAVDGDPSVAGKPYSLYLKLADGQWIPPHWHPEDKRVFVVSGTLLMGMGTSLDKAAAVAQPAGTFNLVPAKTRHYEGAKGETILLLYGIGPLSTFYLK